MQQLAPVSKQVSNLELKPISFYDIQHFFVDFQKKSNCYELPTDTMEYIGAFKNGILVGYFILQCYKDRSLDIIQGYLKKEYRHNKLYSNFMHLLEQLVKNAGYTKIRIKTNNRFQSYYKFMKSLGYRPMLTLFTKEV